MAFPFHRVLVAVAMSGFAASASYGGSAKPIATDGAPNLAFPLQCRLGKDCFIQNFTDVDPSSDAHDFMCGSRTYEQHSGTDIRLKSMAQQRVGVPVLAAAAGVVLRTRDTMPDISVKAAGAASVAGNECGNGLLIDHGQGWSTQYCHMARGSIRVRSGQSVTPGTPLGLVGISGNSEYPHLHISVRHQDKTVDPFAIGALPGACGGGKNIWSAASGLQKAYQASEMLNAGFTTAPLTAEDLQAYGDKQPSQPSLTAPAIVAFAQAIGLRQGDIQKLTLRAPDGMVLAENLVAPLNNNKAQVFLFTGKKRPSIGWTSGTYSARYTVLRDNKAVIDQTFSVALR